MAPQPYYVEWSPTTRGSDPPSWETLGRIYELNYTRDLGDESTPIAPPGKMSCSVRGSTIDGTELTLPLDVNYRHVPIRVAFDNGIDGAQFVWAGYVTRFMPDMADTPRAVRYMIDAVDGLGVGTRSTVTRDEPDEIEGDFKGWLTNVTDLPATEVDLAFLGNAANHLGSINAPVTLPPKFVKNDDTYTTDAKFSEKALTALAKALDVEMGQAGVAGDGALWILGRYAVPGEVIAYEGTTHAIKFTGEADDADPLSMPWRRGSLVAADPYAEYKNWATTKGLSDTVFEPTTVPDPAPEPVDSIDRTDLWSTSDNWMQANADLLAELYVNVNEPTFEALDVLVWDSAQPAGAPRATLLHAVTYILGIGIATVTVPTPEGIATRLAMISGISMKITSASAIATVRLSRTINRWDQWLTDNSSGHKLFALDTPGAGLDAGATLGP